MKESFKNKLNYRANKFRELTDNLINLETKIVDINSKISNSKTIAESTNYKLELTQLNSKLKRTNIQLVSLINWFKSIGYLNAFIAWNSRFNQPGLNIINRLDDPALPTVESL